MALPVVAARRAPARTAGTSGAPQQAPAQGAPPVAVTPFTRAALPKSMFGFTYQVPMGVNPQPVNPQPVPPAGFVRWIELTISAVTTGNAAAVAFAADGPFSVLGQIYLSTSGGDNLIQPITGYQLYLFNKYGVFAEDPWDAKLDYNFTAVTGAGANGGSFSFSLRLPIEVDSRDAYCAIPNSAANREYIVGLNHAAASSVYAVPPTTLPVVTVTAVTEFWSTPQAATAGGVPQETQPRGTGALSLIKQQPYSVGAGGGDRTVKFQNVGNIMRGGLLILRNAAGARVEADFPQTIQWLLNNDLWRYQDKGLVRNEIAQGYNLRAGLDQPGGQDAGVFPFFHTLNNLRGSVQADAPRDNWLPLLDAALLQIRGFFGPNAATLEILTNEIKAPDPAALYSLNFS